LYAERLTIEAGEPTVINALNVVCHNEEAAARGYEADHQFRVGWFQQSIAQIGTLPWFKPEPLKAV
jgi:hypothetical protein